MGVECWIGPPDFDQGWHCVERLRQAEIACALAFIREWVDARPHWKSPFCLGFALTPLGEVKVQPQAMPLPYPTQLGNEDIRPLLVKRSQRSQAINGEMRGLEAIGKILSAPSAAVFQTIVKSMEPFCCAASLNELIDKVHASQGREVENFCASDPGQLGQQIERLQAKRAHCAQVIAQQLAWEVVWWVAKSTLNAKSSSSQPAGRRSQAALLSQLLERVQIPFAHAEAHRAAIPMVRDIEGFEGKWQAAQGFLARGQSWGQVPGQVIGQLQRLAQLRLLQVHVSSQALGSFSRL